MSEVFLRVQRAHVFVHYNFRAVSNFMSVLHQHMQFGSHFEKTNATCATHALKLNDETSLCVPCAVRVLCARAFLVHVRSVCMRTWFARTLFESKASWNGKTEWVAR